MNILVVNTLTVPSGQASVNRILSLSRGLVENGDNVTVLSSAKGEDTQIHDINGLKYQNFNGSSFKIIGLIVSLIKILKYIHRNKKDINVLWLVTNNLLLIYPLCISCKLYKIKYIQEKSEFPFVLMKNGIIAKIWGWLYIHTTYKLFDGMIIMTQPLWDYFKNIVRKDCKLIKVPMTVDVTRFENTREYSMFGDYAAYCGNMSGNKDGVKNLIEAFSYVEAKHPNFKLVMMGGANTKEEFDQIKQNVINLNLKNVIFTGCIPRDEVPHILNNAKILCLARPSSLQSSGGFPTKLGEYLATGHPVVVTAVGDIPSYLNKRNSYIVEPDNNEKFGETINEILNNYENALAIGLEGKKVALENFNYKVQSARLHNYFIELTKQ